MGQTQFVVRSCCDLDLQGSDQNVVRHTSCQHGDYFCEIVLNLTTNNEVMCQTQFQDVQTDGRTDAQLSDYMLPQFFQGA